MVLNPKSIPTTVEELERFGDKGIENLKNFYGKASNENPALNNSNTLSPQYKAYKVFVIKNCIDYETLCETKKRAKMNKIDECLNEEKSKLAKLLNILSKRKKIKIKKNPSKYWRKRNNLS